MFYSLIGTLALCLVLPSLATPHSGYGGSERRHSDLARRVPGDIHLYKRFSQSKWTFYDVEVGLGACGKQNYDNDFTVALNSAQYGGGYPGPHCFQTITMRYKGKTATATIMDECPGCPYGGLDLTRGLFSYFENQDKGVVWDGEWWFGSDGGNEEKPTTTTKKTTTKEATTWTPPTTTWEAPTTTTTSERKTTTSHTPTPSSTPVPETRSTEAPSSSSAPSITTGVMTSESVISTSTVDFANGLASGLALPTGTIDTDSANNINTLNSLFVQFGGVIIAGANAKA